MNIDLLKFHRILENLSKSTGGCYQIQEESYPSLYEVVEAGLSLRENGLYSDAVWCFEQIIDNIDRGELSEFEEQTTEMKSVALTDIAHCYVLEKRYDEAIHILENSLLIWSNNAIAYSLMGSIFYNVKDFEKSLSFHRKAIEIEPKIHESWNTIGIILSEHSESYEEAVIYFDNAITYSDEKNTRAWINKGNVLLKLDKPDDAIICYDNAFRINPKESVHAILNKVIILSDRNKTKEALIVLDEAKKIIDRNHPYYSEVDSLYNKIKNRGGYGINSLFKIFSQS